MREDGEFLGYLRLEGTFDPVSGKLVYRVPAALLEGTRFLPVVLQPAWVANHDPVSYVHPAYPDQVRIVGPTPVGRWLTVALEPAEDKAVWRPVTGWDATEEEREYHRDEYR